MKDKSTTIFFAILHFINSTCQTWFIHMAKQEGLRELIETGFTCVSLQIGLFGFLYFLRKL